MEFWISMGPDAFLKGFPVTFFCLCYEFAFSDLNLTVLSMIAGSEEELLINFGWSCIGRY